MATDKKTALEEEKVGYETRLKGALEAGDKDAADAMRSRVAQVDEQLGNRKPKVSRDETYETADTAPPETAEARRGRPRKTE